MNVLKKINVNKLKVYGGVLKVIFQMVSRHLANVFISYDLKLRYRRSGDGNFFKS